MPAYANTASTSLSSLTDGTVLFVGKAGNDANSGKAPGAAKLTITAAINALPVIGGFVVGSVFVFPGIYSEALPNVRGHLLIEGLGTSGYSNAFGVGGGRYAAVQINVPASSVGFSYGNARSFFANGPTLRNIHFVGDGSANQIGIRLLAAAKYRFENVTCSDFSGTGSIGYGFYAGYTVNVVGNQTVAAGGSLTVATVIAGPVTLSTPASTGMLFASDGTTYAYTATSGSPVTGMTLTAGGTFTDGQVLRVTNSSTQTMYGDLWGCNAMNCSIGADIVDANGVKWWSGIFDHGDNALPIPAGTTGIRAWAHDLRVEDGYFQAIAKHIDHLGGNALVIRGTRHESFGMVGDTGDATQTVPGPRAAADGFAISANGPGATIEPARLGNGNYVNTNTNLSSFGTSVVLGPNAANAKVKIGATTSLPTAPHWIFDTAARPTVKLEDELGRMIMGSVGGIPAKLYVKAQNATSFAAVFIRQILTATSDIVAFKDENGVTLSGVGPSGAIRTISGPTTSRPTPAVGEVGASYFDTTLNYMVWWNGFTWRKYDGTVG